MTATDDRGSDTPVAVGLFCLGVLTRLPFRSQVLYHWDSVNFALGIESFDVYLHQPHPPGYFLYVMLGRLINLLMGDANASLVGISIVASGLAAVGVFFLGRSLWDRRSGIIAALLLLSGPLFWFHGEVALSYMVEAVFVTLVALLCYHHLTGRDNRIWLSALVLGLAGGFRQNTMVFLLPLWVVAVWRSRWQELVLALVVLASTCAAWLVPMMILTGGVERYWEAIGGAGQIVAEESSLFDGTQMAVNGARLIVFACYALLIGLIPLALGTWHWVRENLKPEHVRAYIHRIWLFLLWITPSLGFYLFVHIRQPGHTFTFMPAVLLLAAASIAQVADWIGERHRDIVYAGLIVAVISVNSIFFLSAPPTLFDSTYILLSAPSRRSIQTQDFYVAERVRAIQAHFDPQRTALLAAGRSYRYPDYYLRDYQYASLSYQLAADKQVLENADTLVLFDAVLLDRVSEPAFVHSLTLPDGNALAYVDCSDGETIVVSSERIACQRQE